MTTEEAVNGFLTGYFSTNHRSDKTERAYKLDLLQLTDSLGAKAALRSVSGSDIERWVLDLRMRRKLKPASIRRKVAVARLLFTYWVRRGDIENSPFWRVHLDLKGERLLPRNLSPGDVTRLIESTWRGFPVVPVRPCDAITASDFRIIRNVAALEILFATGIRVGELVALRVNDWNDEDCSFVVRGKGALQRLAFLPDKRSVHAVRTYLAVRQMRTTDSDRLLITSAGLPFMSQGVADVIAKAAKRARISLHVTPHMIRHTVATLLLRYGADIRIVQEVLGHSSIATTQRYVHVSKEHLRSILGQLHPNHHLSVRVLPR